MLNNPTKQEVIEALISLRDRIISEIAQYSPEDIKERWYIPDCLAYAINYLECGENDIEPRDTIELPYKHFKKYPNCISGYDVFYRGKDNDVYHKFFYSEAYADAFIKEIKGEME